MDLGDIAWAFVDAAGEHPRRDLGRPMNPEGAAFRALSIHNMFCKRNKNGVAEAHGLFGRGRPEGRKDVIAEVLSEQETWTVEQVCARVEIPLTQAERVSVGHIMSELGWQRKRILGRTAIYTREGWNLTELALKNVLPTQERWTIDELCAIVGHRNLRGIGGAMKRLGWIAKTNWTSRKNGKRHEFKTYVKEIV